MGIHRPKDDFYETPSWVTEALLMKEPIIGSVLEPACGKGAIAKVIVKHQETVNGYRNLWASDLNNYGYSFYNVNFLENYNENEFSNVVTNPPFRLAQEFIERGLFVSSQKVIMFLRLSFLESQARKKFFENTPLRTVYVMSKRVTMYPNEFQGDMKNGGTTAMAWFVWEHGYKGKPQLEWL